MIKVSVELDNDLLSQIQSQLSGFTGSNGSKIAPGTKTAFDRCVSIIQRAWQNWANGGSVEGADDIKNPNPRLSSSIKKRYFNDFDAEVYSDSKQMEWIEKGRNDIYMKKEGSPWLTSHKTRIIKHGKNKGKPYLIIPFRWGTPNDKGGARAHFGNTIPESLYNEMKKFKFKKSFKTSGTHLEPNIHGEQVQRQEYDWGDRLNEEGNINGLVRMAGNPRSTYFTFRIISAQSKADWHIKAIKPNPVVESLERSLKSRIENTLEEGLSLDIDF